MNYSKTSVSQCGLANVVEATTDSNQYSLLKWALANGFILGRSPDWHPKKSRHPGPND